MALASVLFSTMARADEAVYSSFQSEMSSILDIAKARKRMVAVYTSGGTVLVGDVAKIMPDAIMLKTQQNHMVLIRIDRINAIDGYAGDSYKPSK